MQLGTSTSSATRSRTNHRRSWSSGFLMCVFKASRKLSADRSGFFIQGNFRRVFCASAMKSTRRFFTLKVARRPAPYRKIGVGINLKTVTALSQKLSWSHFVELIVLEDSLKRDFYAEMCRRLAVECANTTSQSSQHASACVLPFRANPKNWLDKN